jgi:nucleoside-diphosphate-sugar epimerase
MTSVGRFLVTGCAGFIGSHLVEALLEEGEEVVGVDSFTDYYARSVKEANLAPLRRRRGFAFVEADLVEADLAPLVAGVGGVFHLAAQPGVRGSWGDSFAVYVRENLIATQRLFEVAARSGVRVVFASSSSVYGDAEAYPTAEDVRPRPISPYGVTKLSCEHLAGAYAAQLGLDVVALRYFTVYGPRQRPDMAFARLTGAIVRRERFHVYGTGEQSRDFTYVADAVAATQAAMERGRSEAVYNVGGGAEASLRDVLELCEKLAGRAVDVVFDRSMLGDVRRTAADTSRIRADLAWAPRTSLEEGIAAQLAWSEAVLGNPRAASARARA